jgi:hypothetical protein
MPVHEIINFFHNAWDSGYIVLAYAIPRIAGEKPQWTGPFATIK